MGFITLPATTLATALVSAAAAVAMAAPAHAGAPTQISETAPYEAVVVYRNPGAQFRHNVAIVKPTAAALCDPCAAGDKADLGNLDAGTEVRLAFGVTRLDGSTVMHQSDTSGAVQVSRIEGGWRFALEDGGGPPEDLIVEVRRAAVTTTTTVRSSDYKVVRYIQDFDLKRCVGSYADEKKLGSYLKPFGPIARLGNNAIGEIACRGIKATANEIPADGIAETPDAWRTFLARKQYRGIVHLPSHRMTCDADGRVAGMPTPEVPALVSTGFTPVTLPFAFGAYTPVPGDPFIGAGGVYNRRTTEMTKSPDGRSVHLTLRVAARAGYLEAMGARQLNFGQTLPFIWTTVEQDLRCDGTAPTAVTFSDMPTTVIFRDDKVATRIPQTVDLGGFHASGDDSFLPSVGRLSDRCAIRAFDLPLGASAHPACEAKVSYGGGPFGSGWLPAA